MNPVLEEALLKKEFIASDGNIVKIHSETSKAQCEFLQKIIIDNNFKDAIEIGLAFGISAIAITEAVTQNGGRHLAIDKFQYEGWKGYGLDLIEKAGYKEKVNFSDLFCYQALPKLLEEQRKFDFAYVDSTKQFDWILLDFFYLDKLLNIGGIVVFDDVGFSGIKKVLRYISQFPSYIVYAKHPANHKPSFSRARMLPKFFPGARKLFKEEIILPDHKLGINANCIALKKIGEDKRNWDWHVKF